MFRGGTSPKVLVRDFLQCTKTLLLSHWSLASQVVALGCALLSNLTTNTSLLRSWIIMAILHSLPGVEITVVVDGEDLHEYQDTDMEDEENTVTKYVEAVTGANFAIKACVSQQFKYEGDCLNIRVAVDGLFVSSPLIEPGDTSKISTSLVDGVIVGDENIRKLRFSELEIVNEHGFGLPKDLERVKNLGCIKVRVSHLNLVNKLEESLRGSLDIKDGFISEKAIKGQALTHSYSLDEETKDTCPRNMWKTTLVPGTRRGDFRFYYRSKVSLRELMIVPRTPSPVPLRERPIETLSEAEKAELISQLLAETASNVRVKKEVKRELEDDDYDNDSRARKRARPSASAINFEINDDDTFTEVTVTHKEKEKEVIALD
ncbi:hypothetical protein D6D06_01596 [Aureobasidium pullulans]|nr:hypothetical protein D6D06_01596 [Aureobasidium pullulans]